MDPNQAPDSITLTEPAQPASVPQPIPQAADNDDSEETVLVAYKHLAGLLAVYIEFIFGLLASMALIYFLLPTIMQDTFDVDQSTVRIVAMIVVYSLIALTILILSLFTIVYRGNRLVLTNKNVRQYTQTGLFHTAVSQLSLANIEDVTAKKQGFFATMLNYGFLTIETAGEQENFEFYYCPNATNFADAVLKTRSRYVSAHPGEAS